MNDFNKTGTQVMNALSPRMLQRLAVATLLMVGLTIALAVFVSWWFLCVGPLLYLGVLYILLRDTFRSVARSAIPLAGSPARSYDLSLLDGQYRTCVERALSTRTRIERVVAETADPGLRSALASATSDLPELTETIYELARKAQSIKSAMLDTGDMSALSSEIERLDNAIRSTNDEFQKSQYHAALDGKLQQMQNYTDTTVALQRWDAQIDNALSTLDTILSQVVRIRSSEMLQRTASTDDLSHELRAQVEALKAASDAFDTLYGGSDSSSMEAGRPQ